MYINNKTAKFGIVSIGIDRNSYRLRFVYLKKRYSITIGKVSDECFKIARAKAQEINSDILMERFDKTLAKYSPRHAQALETANKPKNLKDIWEHYKASNRERIAKSTQNYYWIQYEKNVLNNVIPQLLDLSNAVKFIESLRARYKPSTLDHIYRSYIRPSINLAIEAEIIDSNPYKFYKFHKKRQKAINVFTDIEVKAIIEAFYNDTYCLHKSSYKHSFYAPLIEFLALTACRPEEAFALTKSDIKVKADRTYIRFNKTFCRGVLMETTKTHVVRLFPCGEQLFNLLHKLSSQGELLFPSVKQSYVNVGNFRKRYWSPVVKGLVKDGLVEQYLKLYCLRHSGLTRMIHSSIDIATVAKLGGTSTSMICKHYLGSNNSSMPPEL